MQGGSPFYNVWMTEDAQVQFISPKGTLNWLGHTGGKHKRQKKISSW